MKSSTCLLGIMMFPKIPSRKKLVSLTFQLSVCFSSRVIVDCFSNGMEYNQKQGNHKVQAELLVHLKRTCIHGLSICAALFPTQLVPFFPRILSSGLSVIYHFFLFSSTHFTLVISEYARIHRICFRISDVRVIQVRTYRS